MCPKLIVPLQIDRAITMTVPGRTGRQRWPSGLHQAAQTRHTPRPRNGVCITKHPHSGADDVLRHAAANLSITDQALRFPSRGPNGERQQAPPPRQRFNNVKGIEARCRRSS